MGDLSPASALQRFIEPFAHFFATPEIWQTPLTERDWHSEQRRLSAPTRRRSIYLCRALPAYLYRAYIQYDGINPLAFRIGAFSPCDSIEDATGGANLAFLERPTAVTIARSIAGGSGREGAEIFAQGDNYLVSLAYTGGKTADAATFDEQQGLVARAAWLAVNRSTLRWRQARG